MRGRLIIPELEVRNSRIESEIPKNRRELEPGLEMEPGAGACGLELLAHL